MRPHAIMALAALALCAAAALTAPPSTASAERDRDKERYQRLQKVIQRENERLERSKTAEAVTLSEIEDISKRMLALDSTLSDVSARLGATQKKIDELTRGIATLEKRVAERKEWLRGRLRSMHRYGPHGDRLMLLGSASDMAALTRRIKYLDTLAESDREMIDEYGDSLKELGERRAALERLAAQARSDEKDVREASRAVSSERERKQRMLASIRKQKDVHRDVIAQLNRSAANLLNVIRESERRREDEYRASRSSSGGAAGFRGQRGSLPWPVAGRVAIPYGTQNDPQFHTPVFRNGVYVASDEGAEAHAVYDGKVVFANWFEGYGQLVIINHGDGYHSLYGNLSEIFPKPGDIIKRQDRIGRVGTSGLTERPSLYFEIRYKGKPLNPAQWLRK